MLGKKLHVKKNDTVVVISGKDRSKSGIVEKEAPVHISNVMLLCGKCKKPVRTKITVLEDGKKARCCVKCGESFDK